MNKTLIECKNLTLGYEGEKVLENISLSIPQGVFLPFVGPNGAGKTTLLKGILGLIQPMAGEIRTPFKQAPAGYVPQHKAIDSLFPLTVREIVSMGFYPKLGWWKKPGKEENRILEEALEELRLTQHAHKNYRDLSGGTKQKTLIARALVSGAEVFIMDEPTSELDEASERNVFEHLFRFVKEENKTVLFAHHGLNEWAYSAALEVCMVNQGEVKKMSVQEFKSKSKEFV